MFVQTELCMKLEDNMEFSHIDKNGKATMVNISNKKRIKRTAIASGKIYLNTNTIQMIKENQIKKGDVLSTARIAGIMGAKQTAYTIPLCHNIEIDFVGIDFKINSQNIEITCKAVCTDKTGIEMEALTGVSVAALTIYDMCKAVDKNMTISDIKLMEKTKEEI